MSVEDTHLLIVFARVPRRGEVKTRLAAAIGADGALQAYRALLHRTVAVGAALPHTTRWLCLSGEDDAGECRELATRHGYRITRQADDPDLGVPPVLDPYQLLMDAPTFSASAISVGVTRSMSALWRLRWSVSMIRSASARSCAARSNSLAWL